MGISSLFYLQDTPKVSLAGATLVLAFILTYIHRKKRQSQPYSSIPCVHPRIPILGNTLSLDMARCHHVLTDWAAKFGPVFRMKVYGEEILVLNNYEAIHDALVVKGSDFAGRPNMARTQKAGRQIHSIVWQTYTHKLQFLRKEVLRWVKMDAAGQEGLEQKCFPEIETVVGRIEKLNGAEFNPRHFVFDAVLNIMMAFTFGQNLDPSDPKIARLKEINSLFNDVFGSGKARMLDFLPWLKSVWDYGDYAARHDKALSLRDSFWKQELEELKNDTSRHDCIVNHLLTISKEDVGKQLDIQEQTAKDVFTNLILAGTDTTTTALIVLLLVLVHRPEIQQACWEEINAHAPGRHVRLSDRENLHYVQAVILEVLRFSSHVPLAVPHCTMKDTDVLGYPVPKDMTTYINLWAMHHDPKHWPQPFNFDPSRFLDDSNNLVPVTHPTRRKLMPFGGGRRVCLAEALAKNRLFLFASALIQRFKFLPPSDLSGLPPLDSRQFEMGLVIHPKPFNVSAEPR